MTALKLRLVNSRYLKHSRVEGSSFSSSRSWTGLCHIFLHAVSFNESPDVCNSLPLDYGSQLIHVDEIVQNGSGFRHDGQLVGDGSERKSIKLMERSDVLLIASSTRTVIQNRPPGWMSRSQSTILAPDKLRKAQRTTGLMLSH